MMYGDWGCKYVTNRVTPFPAVPVLWLDATDASTGRRENETC